ncbi:hypothetical protein B0H13DRAFT_2111857 [Mycena leptocephala]|nr:hypothetical protein B0H13DRAFT_2111857 [Mycena leptocephala]
MPGGGVPEVHARAPITRRESPLPNNNSPVTPPRQDTPYPILTLPTEITAEIFARCLPNEPAVPRTDTAPLLLGRICSTWRTISLATPELWSFLKPWLSRAQSWPLTLTGGQCIAVLKRYSHLWRDVGVGLRFDQFALFGPDLHLPMLERLAIGASDYPDPVEDPLTVFRSAPALRHLHLQESILPDNMVLPWAQLTSFESDAQSAVECMDILRCTPNLVDCVLNIHFFTDSEDLLDVPPLTFLASLRISSYWWGVLDILHHITVPALQKLDLKGVAIRMDYYLPPLHRFLSKPECHLSELSIQLKEVDENVEEVIQLLETQPTLERLALCAVSSEVLTAIWLRLSDEAIFLPRVRDFYASTHIVARQHMFRVFSRMLDALITTLSMRWVAPIVTAELARIQKCTVFYTHQD